MALTDQQKIDVRRHLGYPVYGGVPVQAFGYRFFTWYGTLEFRMNNMSAAEEITLATVYLANLSTLETAILGASDNLDTARAAVWEHNRNEVGDRTDLYNKWRKKLANFLGVPVKDEAGDGVRVIV